MLFTFTGIQGRMRTNFEVKAKEHKSLHKIFAITLFTYMYCLQGRNGSHAVNIRLFVYIFLAVKPDIYCCNCSSRGRLRLLYFLFVIFIFLVQGDLQIWKYAAEYLKLKFVFNTQDWQEVVSVKNNYIL